MLNQTTIPNVFPVIKISPLEDAKFGRFPMQRQPLALMCSAAARDWIAKNASEARAAPPKVSEGTVVLHSRPVQSSCTSNIRWLQLAPTARRSGLAQQVGKLRDIHSNRRHPRQASYRGASAGAPSAGREAVMSFSPYSVFAEGLASQ